MGGARVTFKNEPKITGLRAVGNSAGAEIKFGGRRCGTIIGASWHSRGFQAQIAVKSSEHPGWSWIMPRHAEADIKTMKEWVKLNFDKIVNGRELHFFDD